MTFGFVPGGPDADAAGEPEIGPGPIPAVAASVNDPARKLRLEGRKGGSGDLMVFFTRSHVQLRECGVGLPDRIRRACRIHER